MRVHDVVAVAPRKRVRTTVGATDPEHAPDLIEIRDVGARQLSHRYESSTVD